VNNDTPTGTERAPDRYTSKGRETIDRQRDLAHALFATPGLADKAFAYLCTAQALKYDDRRGLKGTEEDAAYNDTKAAWYRAMADHVQGRGPDPRAKRTDYVPWTAPPPPRDPRHDPRVGDTKSYYDKTYVVTHTNPLRYVEVGRPESPQWGADTWPVPWSGNTASAVWACGDDS